MADLELAASELEKLTGRPVLRNEPMAMRNTWRVGGSADLYADARSAGELVALSHAAYRMGLAVTILGKGSNVLVADEGVAGLVIGNRAHYYSIDAATGIVIAESGVSQPHLARQTAELGLGGFAWAVAIPGTVGGGVISNAGAFGGCFADVIETATVFDPSVEIEHGDLSDILHGDIEGAPGVAALAKDELCLGYRLSRFRAEAGKSLDKRIVLAARFRLYPADADELQANIAAWTAQRRQRQPTEPSAGSTFKNPIGTHAGKLIEEAGLKGTQQGEAVISPKHANFILNMGAARASDILALIELARERVREQTGIELVPEVVKIGRFEQN